MLFSDLKRHFVPELTNHPAFVLNDSSIPKFLGEVLLWTPHIHLQFASTHHWHLLYSPLVFLLNPSLGDSAPIVPM
jgi:hypothetical protein